MASVVFKDGRFHSLEGAAAFPVREGARYTIQSLGGSLFLLGPEEGAGHWPIRGPARVTFRGDLERFSFPDLMTLVNANRKSGILQVVAEGAVRSLFFKDGDVVFATSSHEEDRLGESLKRSGQVSMAALTAASGEVGPQRKLGKILVEKGILSPKELWLAIRRQVQEIIVGVFRLRTGEALFVEGEVQSETLMTFGVGTPELIMEGIREGSRNINESRRFRELIPSSTLVVCLRSPSPSFPLKPGEQRVLDRVNGTSTVAALCQQSGLEEVETLRTLVHLLRAGFICLQEGPGETAVATAALRTLAENMNALFLDIYAIVSGKTSRDQARQHLGGFFQDLPDDLRGVYAGLGLDAQGGLDLSRLLANVGRVKAQARREVLLKALNELLYFELFQLRQYLTPDEGSELMEIVRGLQGEGEGSG